ncbi:hypothetical protein [Cytobacillus praedii]|uniref:hypothetical protein n=1 Tax=Cytobacillus praedii TaxID=1742358 RepID=UPI002E23852E|nr:hypothetical protein [Cytobacillus praedii]
MNIAKQKEILSLKAEVSSIEKEFNERLEATNNEITTKLITDAAKELLDFLVDQEFKIDETNKNQNHIVARLGQIWVGVSQYPSSLSVRMSNGEDYSISTQSTLLPLDKTVDRHESLMSQDNLISILKKRIDEVKNKMGSIDNQEYRYKLTTEEKSYNRMDYKNEIFREFKDIMTIMFS